MVGDAAGGGGGVLPPTPPTSDEDAAADEAPTLAALRHRLAAAEGELAALLHASREADARLAATLAASAASVAHLEADAAASAAHLQEMLNDNFRSVGVVDAKLDAIHEEVRVMLTDRRDTHLARLGWVFLDCLAWLVWRLVALISLPYGLWKGGGARVGRGGRGDPAGGRGGSAAHRPRR